MAIDDVKALAMTPPLLTVAVAESLTSGHLQALIGSVSGASGFFLGGVTAYTLGQKVSLLGVDRSVAEPVNCVSAPVAEQMARGVCELFGSAIGVATTGYAEPAAPGASPHAYWCIVSRGGPVLRSGKIEAPGLSRTEVQRTVAGRVGDALVDAVRAIRAS